jgi:TonB-linked SusC/RagA family outer membrane protein
MQKTFILLVLVTLSIIYPWHVRAQERNISGRVTSAADNSPLPGVNVVVKGSSTGSLTDADGRYTIQAPAGSTLIFSYIGFATQELAVGNSTTLNVSLAEDVRSLDEVVVTALGIEREKRSLTYAVQEIRSDEIIRAREVNVVNALNAKVAGVQIVSQAGTPGAASSINIRGKSSFLGNSQPLFVVDGIPINNSFQPNARSSGVDIPNRAVDINPDDIESMSILKGPAAAALYGIQAGNGVVIITTKRGSRTDQRTTTVNVSSTASVEQVNKLFQLQDRFAQGSNGVFDDSRLQTFMFGAPFSDLRFNGIPDAMDPNGRIVPATDPTARQDLPVVPYDNQETFWQNGSTFNNHVSIASGNRDGNYYLSIGNLSQNGVIPLNTFRRTTVKLTAEAALNPKLRLSGSASYINSGGRRVGRGDNFTGVVQGIYRTPRNFDNSYGGLSPTDPASYQFPNGTQRNFRNRNQDNGFIEANPPDSPVWTVNKNPFVDDVDRIIGFAQANYQILPWLNALYRVGADVFSDRRNHTFDIGSFGGDGRFGRVFEETYIDKTFNSDLILSANKTFADVINTTLIVGYNYFNTSSSNIYIAGNTFNQPGFFNISNATVFENPRQSFIQRATFAAYSSLKVDYRDFIFLELTGRNEWASTLPSDNNSFFFPSANLGFVFTEPLGLSSSPILPFGKVRVSYATMGRIPDPYVTQTFFERARAAEGFGIGIDFPLRGSNIGGTTASNRIGNPELRPETNTTIELGADLSLLNGRISVDFTYYNSRNRNQIFPVTIPSSSGYTSRLINAGELQNRGIEVVLNTRPVRGTNFSWDLGFNFTRNRNYVIELVEGLGEIQLPGFGTIFQPRLVPGQQFGVFYGSGWQRNEQGQRIIGADGFPVRQEALQIIGNPNPDFLLGIRNTFTFRDLTLSFLWDIRQGGDVWNGTEAVLTNIGATVRTEQRGQEVVFDGVLADGSPNTQPVVLTQAWFQGNGRATGAAGVHEQFVEDASWIRLRDINLSYNLPRAWMERIFIKNLTVGAFGRNVLLFTPYSGIDPEVNLYGIGPSAGLDYFGNPNTRSFGLSLNATF